MEESYDWSYTDGHGRHFACFDEKEAPWCDGPVQIPVLSARGAMMR